MTHTNRRVEIRKCIKCGVEKEIIQRYKHTTNICLECSNEQAKLYARNAALKEGRRVGVNGRMPYPLEPNWAYLVQKFQAMQKQMKSFKKRKDWIEQIKINLENTLNNKEVMDWIHSHKDDDNLTKPKKKIEQDYPDTRYMTWEEYERGLGDNEVDS